MSLSAGTKLGPYAIKSSLGAGGMGEVYRACDTRLDRDVAIKVLPSHLTTNPQMKARFEREARAISALSHPHICHLYDLGHQDGTDYLVMELLEGESLADRLQKGPLPLKQALEYSVQIADALEAAHKNRIVHRDLKPANIILTKSGAKLLDFGLAKPAPAVAAVASEPTLTVSKPLTGEGMVLGTYQYMAPEQVEGKEADARTDIFAFGAVLYEMVTGKRAFQGKSQFSVMSAILEREPEPISTVKPLTPRALEHVVTRALAKNPDERWQSATDLKSELKWVLETDSGVVDGGPIRVTHRKWDRASWLLVAISFLLAMAGGVAWWKARAKPALPMYFHASVPFAANDLSLSPDGHFLAIVAYFSQVNSNVLWVYEVGGRRTNPLNGTQGASYPFWSPDGRFIGFFADGKLKKVEVAGGQVQALCEAPNGRGGTWNREGVVLFSPDANPETGLFRVSSQGGLPAEVTTPETSRFETSHRWPQFLPDGKHFLYLAANFTGHRESDAIFLGSLDSREKHQIVSTSANASYAEPGHLLYLKDQTLMAQPFDIARYVLIGEPHSVSDEVLYFPQVDRAVFSVSGNDVLVTQSGKGASLSQLTWFDRGGRLVGLVGTSGSHSNVRLSPDGRRIATDQNDVEGRNIDVWVQDPVRGTKTRLTFDPATDYAPLWTPDGKQVLFGSSRNLAFRLYLKNADGSGPEKEVVDFGVKVQLVAWTGRATASLSLLRRVLNCGISPGPSAWRSRCCSPSGPW